MFFIIFSITNRAKKLKTFERDLDMITGLIGKAESNLNRISDQLEKDCLTAEQRNSLEQDYTENKENFQNLQTWLILNVEMGEGGIMGEGLDYFDDVFNYNEEPNETEIREVLERFINECWSSDKRMLETVLNNASNDLKFRVAQSYKLTAKQIFIDIERFGNLVQQQEALNELERILQIMF